MKLPKCPICGGPHYKSFCFKNPKRKKTLARKYKQAYRTGKTPKHDKVLTKQSLDRKRLIMELDKYCSLIVRISASNQFGIAECYTCGKRIPWKYGDCSHLISRQWGGTRFDLTHLRFCCQHCNRDLHGNLKVFRKKLIKEIGQAKVDELDKKKSRKISTPELQEMLDGMKKKYKNLLEEKKKQIYN